MNNSGFFTSVQSHKKCLKLNRFRKPCYKTATMPQKTIRVTFLQINVNQNNHQLCLESNWSVVKSFAVNFSGQMKKKKNHHKRKKFGSSRAGDNSICSHDHKELLQRQEGCNPVKTWLDPNRQKRLSTFYDWLCVNDDKKFDNISQWLCRCHTWNTFFWLKWAVTESNPLATIKGTLRRAARVIDTSSRALEYIISGYSTLFSPGDETVAAQLHPLSAQDIDQAFVPTVSTSTGKNPAFLKVYFLVVFSLWNVVRV